MTVPVTVQIHPELFPANWLRFPYNGMPIRAVPGPLAGVQRRVVRNLFPKYQIPALRSPTASLDDRWIASTTRWLRRLHRLRKTATAYKNLDVELLNRMSRCSPSGYKLTNINRRPWRYCQEFTCPFCYARSVSVRYQTLRQSIEKAPPGSDLWLARITLTGDRKALARRLRGLRVAAAVSVSLPGMGPEVGQWVHRAVLLTDDRARTAGSGLWTEPLRGVHRTVARVSDWLRYPTRWRGRLGPEGLVGALRSLDHIRPQVVGKKVANVWGAFGAARKDYRRGRGVLDFSGWEPKP